MKRNFISLLLFVCNFSVFAQDARVNFSNALGGTPVPVTGFGITAGSDWTAELIVDGENLASGPLTSFAGTPTGIFNLGEVSIPGRTGAAIQMTINVYQTKFGSIANIHCPDEYLTSTFWQNPSIPTNPPTPAQGLAGSIDSWDPSYYCPEPTSGSLILVGLGMFLRYRKF